MRHDQSELHLVLGGQPCVELGGEHASLAQQMSYQLSSQRSVGFHRHAGKQLPAGSVTTGAQLSQNERSVGADIGVDAT